jgi:hypothetical protein
VGESAQVQGQAKKVIRSFLKKKKQRQYFLVTTSLKRRRIDDEECTQQKNKIRDLGRLVLGPSFPLQKSALSETFYIKNYLNSKPSLILL